MQYGYFDDFNKEYVITNPKTPAPWVNYLGDPNYGAIISNNAGGYSFEKSGAKGRILRYYFNHFDEPGRYIYLKDNKDNDYWSLTFKPVQKDLDVYKNICRHGTGYSTFTSDYKDIYSEVTYYVPLNKTHEVWYVKLKNNSNVSRDLDITGYCEFTSDNNYEQDSVNLQYSLFITKTEYQDNFICQLINPNFEKTKPNDCCQRFFGLANLKVDRYCGSKNKFLGDYHYYANPIGVIEKLNNDLNFNETSCGALQSTITLKPNEEIKLAFVLGMKNKENAKIVLDSYANIEQCEKEIKELKDYWHTKLSAFRVNTPSKEFNSMINTWHAYNCFMTFTWSRAASLIYCGLRNGYGYRDTVQDIQGIIHLDPKAAKEKLTFMLSAQVDNGAGLPLVKFNHNPGHEDTPNDASYVKETGHPAYRADDALWLFPTVYKYISETGDLAYLDQVIPYANKQEDDVYHHLKKAIEFSLNHLGKHKMPVGLHADWNDCLRLGEKGESTFVLMQFYLALNILKEFATYKNDEAYIKELDSKILEYQQIIDSCYDEDRFIRGYTQDGLIIGGRKNKETNMWLNPQTYAVIAKATNKEKTNTILDSVYTILNSKYGAHLMWPPFHEDLFDGALASCYTPGNKENASIFQQTQGWLILAECLNGNGNRAFEYYKESCPAYQNDQAEIRVMEPYVYGQFTEGASSPNHGRSNVHWLTGTASTVMVGCVEGILGIRPDLYGLKLEPAIPDAWDKLTIKKMFRGKNLDITIINHSKEKYLELNGKKLSINYLKETDLQETNTINLFI